MLLIRFELNIYIIQNYRIKNVKKDGHYMKNDRQNSDIYGHFFDNVKYLWVKVEYIDVILSIYSYIFIYFKNLLFKYI